MFKNHPIHVRKKIALVITVGLAIVLVVLLVLIYSHKPAKGTTEPTSRFRTFYTTILERGQSYLGTK